MRPVTSAAAGSCGECVSSDSPAARCAAAFRLARHGLRAAELEHHVRAEVRGRRLLQGAIEIADGREWVGAAQRDRGGHGQRLHGAGTAHAGRVQQQVGDALRVVTLVTQDVRRSQVARAALARRLRGHDRGGHRRLREAQPLILHEQAHVGEQVHELAGRRRFELRQRAGVPQLGVGAEDRDGLEQIRCGGVDVGRAHQCPFGDARAREAADHLLGRTVAVRLLGLLQRAGQLVDHEGVAAGGEVDLRIGSVHGRRQRDLREPPGRALVGQGLEPRQRAALVPGQLRQQRGRAPSGHPAGGEDQRDRKIRDSLRQVQEHTKALGVSEIGVVDQDDERRLLCDIRIRAVNPVDAVEELLRSRRGQRGGIEVARSLAVPSPRLEQLEHDAEGELGFEPPPGRAHGASAAFLGQPAYRGNQT